MDNKNQLDSFLQTLDASESLSVGVVPKTLAPHMAHTQAAANRAAASRKGPLSSISSEASTVSEVNRVCDTSMVKLRSTSGNITIEELLEVRESLS